MSWPVLAAMCLAAAWLGAAGSALLPALLGPQAALARVLLPEFDVEPLTITSVGGSLRLEMSATSVEHLVLRGRVFPPGLEFDVHTPARQTQRQAALALAAAGLIGARSPRWRIAVALLLGGAIAVCAAPVVLAGQLWGLLVDPWSEPSLGALLAGASSLLLHGGDMAAVLLLTMVLSDHARPWFHRTIPAPAHEGPRGKACEPA